MHKRKLGNLDPMRGKLGVICQDERTRSFHREEYPVQIVRGTLAFDLQIDAETARSIEQIRAEVADLTVEATERVVGKVLDSADQRRLVEEGIEGLDFSALERGRS